MSTADVDFYKDMSSLYGKYQIDGLGHPLTRMAKVMTFRQAYRSNHLVLNDLRIYYDGNHSDFVDRMTSFRFWRVYNMTLESGMSAYTIGSDWASQVETTTNGSVSFFYVEVGGKKVAVSHDGIGWKVDNTVLLLPASANINEPADMNSFSDILRDIILLTIRLWMKMGLLLMTFI